MLNLFFPNHPAIQALTDRLSGNPDQLLSNLAFNDSGLGHAAIGAYENPAFIEASMEKIIKIEPAEEEIEQK